MKKPITKPAPAALCRIYLKQGSEHVYVLCWYEDHNDVSTFRSVEGREGEVHEAATKRGFTHYFAGVTNHVRPVHTKEAIDEAFDKSHGGSAPTRTIVTNDWQLTILRKALAESDAALFSPAENYEVGILVSMIDDVLDDQSDEKIIHGFVL